MKDAYDRYIIDSLAVSKSHLVLDDGCGNGRFAKALADLGCQVVALDLSVFLVNEAKKLTEHLTVHVVRADMTHLPLRTSVFDRVLCVHNLWYIKDFRQAIEEIRRVMNVGGKCVADHLNLFNPKKFMDWKFYGALAQSLFGRGFVDLGRKCSSFSEAFNKMAYATFSVKLSPRPPEVDVKNGCRVFASRFLVIGTKECDSLDVSPQRS